MSPLRFLRWPRNNLLRMRSFKTFTKVLDPPPHSKPAKNTKGKASFGTFVKLQPSAKTLSKKRALDATVEFVDLEALPGMQDVVAIVNARCAETLSTMPQLIVDKKVGVAFKNCTGHEVWS